jgi:hypothetical protein
MKYLIIVTIALLLPNDLRASEICFDDTVIGDFNRFENCDKGDIIKVISMVASKPFKNYEDTKDGIMHIDELSRYCSYDSQIILIGETIVKGFKANIYSCVYTGEKREYDFSKNE